jgi:hypothetical protein
MGALLDQGEGLEPQDTYLTPKHENRGLGKMYSGLPIRVKESKYDGPMLGICWNVSLKPMRVGEYCKTRA